MSNATATDTQRLALPRSTTDTPTPPRKITYRAGVETPSVVRIDGNERTVFTNFDAARLIRLSARAQVAGKGDDVRTMLVITMGIIVDGLKVSILEDNNKVPHPLLSDPRFDEYRTLPHRINAQQWMDVKDINHVVELANFLRSDLNFKIKKNPSLPQGSQRKTRDLFQARPVDNINPNRPQEFGAAVDSFEISVNPDYAQGFSSFYEGLTEQMDRWVEVMNEEDEATRAQLEDSLSKNMHFIGGAHFDKKQYRWWPRPVDIGILSLKGKQFPLYPVTGDDLDISELLGTINSEEADQPAPAVPVVDAGPAKSEIADW